MLMIKVGTEHLQKHERIDGEISFSVKLIIKHE